MLGKDQEARLISQASPKKYSPSLTKEREVHVRPWEQVACRPFGDVKNWRQKTK